VSAEGISYVYIPSGDCCNTATRSIAKIVGSNIRESINCNIPAGGERNVVVGADVIIEIHSGCAEQNVAAGHDSNIAPWRSYGIVIDRVGYVGGGAIGGQRNVPGSGSPRHHLWSIRF